LFTVFPLNYVARFSLIAAMHHANGHDKLRSPQSYASGASY